MDKGSHMRRVALAGALALLFVLVPTTVDAQATSSVTFVNASGVGPMDVYIGLSSGSTLSLGAAGVGVAGVAGLGELEAGNYRVLLCVAAANPAPAVAACANNSTPTYLDKKQSIGEDQTAELVFGATAEGTARLSKVNIDTGCVSPGGRLTLGNAADTDAAVVSLDGTIIDDSVPSGKTVKTTALAGTHTVTFSDGAALNLSTPLDVVSQQNTVAYLQGNSNGYAVVAVHQVALGCSAPPATDPSGSTGTNPPAVNANTTTAVNPTFAG